MLPENSCCAGLLAPGCIWGPRRTLGDNQGAARARACDGDLVEERKEPSLGGVTGPSDGNGTEADPAASLRDPTEHRAAIGVARQHCGYSFERNQVGRVNAARLFVVIHEPKEWRNVTCPFGTNWG